MTKKIDGSTIVDLGKYRANRAAALEAQCVVDISPAEPKQTRRRRKNDVEPLRWRAMTDDERNVARTLVSTITTVGPWNDPNERTRAISFMLDMAKKAMIEPDAQVTEKQVDWLWILADKYGLIAEEVS